MKVRAYISKAMYNMLRCTPGIEVLRFQPRSRKGAGYALMLVAPEAMLYVQSLGIGEEHVA